MLQMEDPTTVAFASDGDRAFEAKYGLDIDAERFAVDAERDAEQLSVFDFAFDVALSGNDQAELIGVPVTVTEIRFDGEERRGLVANIVAGNADYTVSLLDLRFVDADLRMQNLLADYRAWVAQR